MNKREAEQEAKRRCEEAEMCVNCKFRNSGKLYSSIDECRKFYAKAIYEREKDAPSPLAEEAVRKMRGKNRTKLQRYLDTLSDAEIVALIFYALKCEKCPAENYCKENNGKSCMHVFCEFFKVKAEEVEDII